MEETLRKSEEKYKKLINTSPDSIALIDESGQFLTINPAMATRLGSSPEKIEGKNFYHVLPGDVAFKRLEKGKEAIAKKEVIYFEDSRDGMHFQNYHIPVDICGDKRCFQIIAKDMTQRKQMEERLQILKDAVESSINGFALADLCGYLTYINPSFLRIGKFDNDVDVLGRHFSEFLPKKKKAFFSWQTLNSQSAWKGELIAKRSDNTLIYIQLFASVVKDKQGTPVCLMGSFIDITDRKKAEKELYQANKHLEQRVIERTQELKKHESRLKRSQQVARVATWERDFQTGEIIWSDEQYRLFGYEPSQLSEREIIKRHISEEDLQQIKGHLRQAIQERQGFNIRFGFTTQDHQQRIAHCLGQVERDEADNPLHIYGTTQDVTEKIEMEQALYKSQQSYEQLLLSTQHLISYKDIIGKSKQMRRIYTLIQQLANVDTTVLITGESGTGKELVMKALHYSGLRAKGPLIKVNCSALSEQLLESELFGHIRGAFTGAVCQKAGRIESAQGGTLFLDEIGEISQNTQLKLLRFLQEKQFERVGEVSPISADVRIIAATNADLSQKVVQGSFRSDLYYRLKVIPIYICPLRERTEDIPLLVRHFCRYFSQSFQKKIVGVSDEVMRFFITYQWPGNVRELKHVIESACIVCSGKIGLEHLPDNLVMRQSNQQEETMGSIFKKKKIGEEELRDALKEARGNKTKAAGLLGVSRRTVYRKISEYHLG
jgi:PAS domain S-box-containing protein